MELSTIRSLNVIGCVLFAIFGGLIAVYLGFMFFSFTYILAYEDSSDPSGLAMVCMVVFFLYLFLIIFLSLTLYKNTVRSIDEGDFERAKRWSLYGAVLGLIFGGGVLTFILFILAYIFIDEALAPRYYYPYPPPGYYPPPPGYYYPPPGAHEYYRKKRDK